MSTNNPSKIKQRIVGGLVLLLVALVLLPNVLRSPNDERIVPLVTKMPDEPQFEEPLPSVDQKEFSVPEMPAPASDVQWEESKPQGETTPEQDTTLTNVVPTLEPVQEKAPVVETQNATPPAAAPKPVKVPVVPAPALAAKEKAVKPKMGSDAWVIQVGSFSSETNAFALRDQLQAKGFTSFVEKSQGAGSASFRVRVGPEILRSEATSIQSRLKKEMALDGVVMRRVQ